MKKTNYISAILLTLFMVTAAELSAQNNVQYKVTRDDPKDICNFWMFIDPFQMDAPFQNFDGFSFNTGITGLGLIQNRIGFDYSFRYGTLTLGKLISKEAKASMQFEAGGMFVFRDGMKIKNKTKVILDIDESTNSNGDRVTTTKFIMIPAQRRAMIFLRGGLYLKRTPYTEKDEELGSDLSGNLTSFGLYAGIGRLGISNVYINTNTDGKARRSGAFRIYADVIICPVRKLNLFTDSSPLPAGHKFINGPVGFRVGMYGMPVESRDIQKRKAFSAGVEVGVRPGDGLYATGSFLFPIARKKLTAFGYKAPTSPEQQTEKE